MDFDDWGIEMRRGDKLRPNMAVLTFVVQKRDTKPLLKCFLRSGNTVAVDLQGHSLIDLFAIQTLGNVSSERCSYFERASNSSIVSKYFS
jgi:hypothetical protein